MQEKIGEPGEKPVEASMDWKPNPRTAPGPGIKPRLRLSGAHCAGDEPLRSPKLTQKTKITFFVFSCPNYFHLETFPLACVF